MVWSKWFIYVETIENIIIETWRQRDYIRCRNMVDFLAKVERWNDVAEEYWRKLSRVDMEKEYRKWAWRHWNEINFMHIIIELVVISIAIFSVMYLDNRYQPNPMFLVVAWICIYVLIRNFIWWFYYKVASLFW